MNARTTDDDATHHTLERTRRMYDRDGGYPPEGIDPMLSGVHADGAPHREARHRAIGETRTPAERATMDPTPEGVTR